MWHATLLIAILLAPLTTLHAADAIVAFPGAEGPAAHATGGRGGEVYIVSNTNTEGPGSLADAVSKPNRFIVFSTSGVIDLTQRKGRQAKGGKLEIRQPNLTIAGQTAPGDGVCLKGGTLVINASNVIVRHLRVRRGFVADGDTGDAVELNPKDPTYVKPKFKGTDKDKTTESKQESAKLEVVTDVLLDHVSASWATDENFTLSGHIDRVHAQHCLIAEALDYTNPKQTPQNHAFGSLFGGAASDSRVGMHHSIYAHHRRRTPQCSAGDGSGDPPVIVDFRNNIVYDSIEALSHTGGHPIRLNFIANYYKMGPSSEAVLRGKWFTLQKSADSRLHATGNVVDGSPEATGDNWKGILYDKKISFSPEMAMARPFDVPAITTHTAEEAWERNLDESGATLPSRDAVDERVARQVRTGTGKVIQKETDLQESWPAYRSLPPLPDEDADGLPDFWERQHGLNAQDATDAKKIAANGYANIEHYVNNTDPRGKSGPVVFASFQDSSFRVCRTGDTSGPLTVSFRISDKESRTVIPAGHRFAVIPAPASEAVLTLIGDQRGCPSRALSQVASRVSASSR